MNSNEILISLVLPIHNEEGNIPELYARAKKVLSNIGGYEIIFVNDGSQDISLKKLLEICDKDKSVKVIDFSRNFGHQMAITAGISHATG
ncbi:MAG: glycosyltransferase, partial [Patescibacteria group bacterium]